MVLGAQGLCRGACLVWREAVGLAATAADPLGCAAINATQEAPPAAQPARPSPPSHLER
jgi:hypothetical protein